MKSSKTKDVNDAVDYLKQQFWQYGTNEIKYNYTRNEFKVSIQYGVHCMCTQYVLCTLYVYTVCVVYIGVYTPKAWTYLYQVHIIIVEGQNLLLLKIEILLMFKPNFLYKSQPTQHFWSDKEHLLVPPNCPIKM